MTDLVDSVRERVSAGRPVRRTLPAGGRLHVDRALPFLCVHRGHDLGTAELVRTQASYLIAREGPDPHLVDAVVGSLVEICGACLVVELWAGEAASPAAFRIHAADDDRLASTVDALATALGAMASTPNVRVEIVPGDNVAPPGREPIVEARAGVLVIGVEVPPIYRSRSTVYPAVLRALARELSHALQRGFFEFTRVLTPARPAHFQMMGRRRLVHAVRDSDRALAEITGSFDFLLAVSPVNADEAWTEFSKGGRKHAPTLRYRVLALDPELGKRRLYALPLDRLEDPVLAQLLRDKRRELDRQLGLLEDRDTPRFLHGSLQLYEPVDDALLAEAFSILAELPSVGATGGDRCGAEEFAARAVREIGWYREQLPSLATTVHVRDDISALLVSHGHLLVPRRLDVAAERVDALLQHEIGTHAVTYANGRRQPLQVLAAGLAGYEALQEGLAMFAEHLAGGLDAERLRLIAARVVAVRRLVEGVAFPTLVAELTEQHGLAVRAAFSVAVRVFRGGGLTKDAIYLRGLLQVLAHLRAGGSLDALLVGKLALDQVPLVEELVRREVLRPAKLRPRWLVSPEAPARLARARSGLRPLELVRGVQSTRFDEDRARL